ncbi:MAG: helix-turn-helix domain-containing protein [Candidatus Brocadiia bacterium]
MARRSSREDILKAAEAVVIAKGASHLTLEAVAKKAGISKGGLIYSFPSKEALLQAMVERMIAGWQVRHEAEMAHLPEGRTREIKARVMAAASPPLGKKPIAAAILAAVAHDPKLVIPIRDERKRMLARMTASGVNTERAAVIVLAAEGLLLLELLGSSPYEGEMRGRILSELLRMADLC